tara:strand:- start:98 stop:1096 length:999 start_codon:yes stop_codon:yes gene_type:complete
MNKIKKNVQCIIKRGDFTESTHIINSVVINQNNEVLFKSGDIDKAYCLRSTLKPFQCAASLKLGTDKKFKFTNKEIAITCASHHGESDHINTVKSILEKLNLKVSNLECGFHFPLNKETKSKLYSNQLKKSNIYNNCSGKHAGLLGLIKMRNENVTGYIKHSHPVHGYITRYIEEQANESADYFAIDGCSLPTPYFNLKVLAKLYMKLITAQKNNELSKVYNVMTQYPKMVSGTKGFDTYFMSQFNGNAVSKGGAEGMQAIAMQTKKYGPISLALKVSDGNHRGNYISCIKILKYLDILDSHIETKLLQFSGQAQTNLNGISIGKIICKIDN